MMDTTITSTDELREEVLLQLVRALDVVVLSHGCESVEEGQRGSIELPHRVQICGNKQR